MIQLSLLKTFLDDYLCFDNKLDLVKIDPYMANGLFIQGKNLITKIGFGVSASLALFNQAKQANCEAIIVHHAFNLPSYPRYDKIFQQRFGFLVKNEISLFGYHFLLDAHPKIGNNVEILKIIGAKPIQPFFIQGNPWGWIGELKKEEELAFVEKKLKSYLSKRSIYYRFGRKKIKRIVALSGKGAPSSLSMQELILKGIDLYITGEVHEWNRELFKEAEINFIAGGHYSTEVFGIKALMVKIKKKFPQILVEWFDLYNEV